jgi:C4-dicarboxylate-specific signal transduction histidine kinase
MNKEKKRLKKQLKFQIEFMRMMLACGRDEEAQEAVENILRLADRMAEEDTK